ncbi:unnamed protein product [Adineta ricciae]|uniref:Uncharacterized protein n=1 Tax=Adineta ricciae TaxID=249248 RepID=A0A815RKZ8_ADIRI|nr:unnamed protein product [Adineta ricciae]
MVFDLCSSTIKSNIMYYDLRNEAQVKKATSLSFGTFSITSDQVLIGIVSEMISLIPSILLIQMFRRLRSCHHRIKSTCKENKKKRSLTFPWWCLFVAYGISLLLGIISIFFIIARGIEFRDVKSQQ